MDKIIGIASLPNRENGLKNTITTLSPQVDHIYVWLNGYKYTPEVKEKNVTFYLSSTNEGAIAKLKILEFIKEQNFYYFTCDDDIIYPPDYVQHNLKYYTKGSIQTSHGNIFKSFPIKKYIGGADENIYFGSYNPYYKPINFVGTGVSLMDSTVAKQINYKEFTTNNMLDVWVSCWAHSNNVPMYIIPHDRAWLKPNNNIDQTNSIWEKVKKDDSMHTQIMNHYYS